MSKNSFIREVAEWVGVILAAIVFSLFINLIIIVNATVPSSSMETTIMKGDRVIGFRLSYLFSDPERGDIAIFKYPDNEKMLFIKRIIGMPGETLEVQGGHVYINGEELEEPYLDVVTEGDFGPYEIPEDSYFMMGDNRNNSLDSRYWDNTFLRRDKIVGKGIIRYFPKIKKLE
jgi:signal peptidase I